MLKNLCSVLLLCTGVATVCAMDNDVPMAENYQVIPAGAPGSPAGRRGIPQKETPPRMAPRTAVPLVLANEVPSFTFLQTSLRLVLFAIQAVDLGHEERLAYARVATAYICQLNQYYHDSLSQEDRDFLTAWHTLLWQVINAHNAEIEG
ncbi:MAG: hypothetical protein QG604_755 [Candidatus Dependentiae bacterium]|nr:hypothetical protein [Candidatus Dependentiae bacterium]